MSVERQTLRLVGEASPEDFGKRLERFMQASGLGPRPLGRLVGVSPYRVREWRRGVVPSGHYLLRLLTVAESLELRHMLIWPDQPLSDPVMAQIGRMELANGDPNGLSRDIGIAALVDEASGYKRIREDRDVDQ